MTSFSNGNQFISFIKMGENWFKNLKQSSIRLKVEVCGNGRGSHMYMLKIEMVYWLVSLVPRCHLVILLMTDYLFVWIILQKRLTRKLLCDKCRRILCCLNELNRKCVETAWKAERNSICCYFSTTNFNRDECLIYFVFACCCSDRVLLLPLNW